MLQKDKRKYNFLYKYCVYTFHLQCQQFENNKTVNGSKTEYQYVGDKLFYEKRGDGNSFYYFYDSYGKLSAIYHYVNGTKVPYHVVTNIQGDVVALYNWSGTKVAEYSYDAWGNCTIVSDSTSTHIATLNPFRYRSYYYDRDLGLYYLQSRYYDSEIGRFINADSTSLLVVSTDSVINKNLYAYCDNNPVCRVDTGGMVWNTIIGVISGSVVGGITAAILDEDIGAGIISGAVSGLITGATLDIIIATGGTGLIALGAAAAGGAIGNGVGSAINQTLNDNQIDKSSVAIDAFFGGICGALSFGLADIGGPMCKTTKEIFSQPTKKICSDMITDLTTDITVSSVTWLNSSKLNYDLNKLKTPPQEYPNLVLMF